MMKPTHTLSGLVLAQGYLTWLGVPVDAASLTNPKLLMFSVPTVAACVTGAVFPDIDIRIKLFGHRTVTHWFPPFLAGAVLAWLLFLPSVFLFCTACLLHIFLDAFTKMGVPLMSPFGRRYGFRLFATGGAGEMIAVVALLFGSAGIWRFFA